MHVVVVVVCRGLGREARHRSEYDGTPQLPEPHLRQLSHVLSPDFLYVKKVATGQPSRSSHSRRSACRLVGQHVRDGVLLTKIGFVNKTADRQTRVTFCVSAPARSAPVLIPMSRGRRPG
jgi:hypothetical protein